MWRREKKLWFSIVNVPMRLSQIEKNSKEVLLHQEKKRIRRMKNVGDFAGREKNVEDRKEKPSLKAVQLHRFRNFKNQARCSKIEIVLM